MVGEGESSQGDGGGAERWLLRVFLGCSDSEPLTGNRGMPLPRLVGGTGFVGTPQWGPWLPPI